jgi:hypothetical protein
MTTETDLKISEVVDAEEVFTTFFHTIIIILILLKGGFGGRGRGGGR